MSLRRLLILLLLVLAPLPIAAVEPAWACSCADVIAQQQVTLPTPEGAAACGYGSGTCGDTVTSAAGAERLSAYRSLVFWSGSGLVLLAVTGGLAWVLTLPGGRVAAASGQQAAREPGDGVDPAERPVKRTK